MISSSSRPGSRPVSRKACATVSARPGWRNWAADKLTATRSPGQAGACAPAVRSTQAPIGTISPVSSADGMKSFGGTRPRSGCRQRSSASTPTVRPLPSCTCGW